MKFCSKQEIDIDDDYISGDLWDDCLLFFMIGVEFAASFMTFEKAQSIFVTVDKIYFRLWLQSETRIRTYLLSFAITIYASANTIYKVQAERTNQKISKHKHIRL